MAYTIKIPFLQYFYTLFIFHIDNFTREAYILKISCMLTAFIFDTIIIGGVNLTEDKNYDIRELNIDEIPVNSMRGKVVDFPDDLATLIEDSLANITSQGGRCSGPPIIIYDKDMDFNSFETELEVAWPVIDRNMANKILPPIHAASVTERLTTEKGLEGAYTALYDWIRKNGYHPAYPIREIFTPDPEATTDEQLLIEIIIPLTTEHD